MFCLILQGEMMILVAKSGFFVLLRLSFKYIHKYGYVDKTFCRAMGGPMTVNRVVKKSIYMEIHY